MAQDERIKWEARHAGAGRTGPGPPTALLETWLDRIPSGPALDVACGAGRNALYLARHGFQVDAVDIAREALRRGHDSARQLDVRVNWIAHDLDVPLKLRTDYAVILNVRYVNLPMIPRLACSLRPGGCLVIEQHLQTDADVKGPANPAFRVPPRTLEDLAEGLEILFAEESVTEDSDGHPVALAQLVARAGPAWPEAQECPSDP